MVHHRDDLGSHIDASAETQDLDILDIARHDMRITATFQKEIYRDRSKLYIYMHILYILYHIWRYLGVYSHPWISAILMLGIQKKLTQSKSLSVPTAFRSQILGPALARPPSTGATLSMATEHEAVCGVRELSQPGSGHGTQTGITAETHCQKHKK